MHKVEDLLPPENDQQKITPELAIDTMSFHLPETEYDWEMILRELNGELKGTPDVDQLFKKMLVFLHGTIDYQAASVGMLQDKSIKKIAEYE